MKISVTEEMGGVQDVKRGVCAITGPEQHRKITRKKKKKEGTEGGNADNRRHGRRGASRAWDQES